MRCANGFLQELIGGGGGGGGGGGEGGGGGGGNGTLWSNDTLALYMYINGLYLHLTIGDSSPTDTERGRMTSKA
jgi:hypothetical protein